MPTAQVNPSALPRARRAGSAVALWVFGVATTIMLIGIWGRAVAGDEAALEASARAALSAEVITDRVTAWIMEGVLEAGDLAPSGIESAVTDIEGLPETEAAVDSLVGQAVAAVLAAPGTEAKINVSAALAPLAPVITERLGEAGIEASPAAVQAALDRVGVVVLDTEGTVGLVGSAAAAHAALTKVVLLAGAVMGLAAMVVTVLARERLRTVRSLLTRIALSALTFALVLRIGSWAVDPRGGRSPIAAGSSVLLRSDLWVMLVVALAAAAAAGAAWATGRRRMPPDRARRAP